MKNARKSSRVPSPDEIWEILERTALAQEEAKRETKELKQAQKEAWEQMQETEKQMQETEKQMQETGKQMKETDKRLNKMIGDSGNQWGALGENLVKGNLAKRLQERGIKVEKVMTHVKNPETEFDIIAINGEEVVVVEVKATLDPSDVQEFTQDIRQFKAWWPEFKDKTIYGAMAFLIKANKQANHLAQKQGFFVIEATGDVIIQNKEDFKPKVFS